MVRYLLTFNDNNGVSYSGCVESPIVVSMALSLFIGGISNCSIRRVL